MTNTPINIYGLHIDSTPNTLCDNIESYKELINNKNTVIQLFVNIDKKHINTYKKFANILKKNNINLIVHASYTINIAQKWDEYSWWITQLLIEIDLANILGAKFIVLHLGKSLDLDINVALNNMYSSLIYIANKIDSTMDIKILLETSSGQGSEMCIRLEDLSRFINKLLNHKNKKISDRFGICIDTCHIYSAGYDINTSGDVIKYIKDFDKYIGLKNLKVLHLNNSKTELGSNKDRHDNIYKGTINPDGLSEFIKLCFKLNVPIILETPDEHIKEDLDFIQLVLEEV
jgi:deoxyribonuclease-4